MPTTQRRTRRTSVTGPPRADSEKGTSKPKPRDKAEPHALAWALVVVLVSVVAIIFSNVRTVAVPEPRLDADTPLTEFSAERAMRHVKVLAHDIGHRIVGSDNNEVAAKGYLLQQLALLESTAAANGWNLEVDVQDASGTVSYEFLFSFFSNVYTNVTNIVVRVSPASLSEAAKENALLVSSHFDSTLGTPGAADDAVAIAVMMETVNNLVHSEASLPHPVIFNFNGAEESFLQAAHGFITSHPWANTIEAFINLEGAGSGGPEILFQTGPDHSWLAEAYAKFCPYPHGSAMAQDIFQSNLYPGDTDFRIYRDFGPHGGKDGSHSGAPGFDMAFYHNGHVYHTQQDTYENVDPGSVQHMGSNVEALVRGVLASEDFPRPGDAADSGAVFTDVFGYFMVLVSDATANVIYSGVACSLLLVVVVLRPVPGNTSVGGQVAAALLGALELLACIVGAVAGGMIAAALFTLMGVSMAWYARPGLVVLMYGAPCVGGMLTAQSVAVSCWSGSMSGHQRRMRALLGQALFFCAIMVWMAMYRLGTACFFAAYGFMAIAGLAVAPLLRRVAPRHKTANWIVTAVMGTAFPIAHGNYLAVILATVAVPVVGKAGAMPALAGEAMIAGVCALGAVLVFHSVLPLVHNLNSEHRLTLRRSMVLVWIVGVVFALISHPYSVARPKRMIVFHNHIFQPATLQMPGALPTMDLAKSTVMLSRFDPSPHALYVEAFQAGAKTIEYGNLELDEPSEISDYTTWQGYFPFSAFLDGVQWEDLPAHPAYSDRDTTPSLVLVSDEKFSDNVRPTHALPEDYGIHHGVDEDSVFLRRRLTLGVHVPQTCWSTLNITTSDMIGWSFSKVIPELTCEDGSALHAAHYTHGSHHQVCSYMARHAGGKGSAAWPFWLEFSDDAEVTVRLATVCSPAHGPMGPVLELFEQAAPSWMSPTITYGTFQEFRIGRSTVQLEAGAPTHGPDV